MSMLFFFLLSFGVQAECVNGKRVIDPDVAEQAGVLGALRCGSELDGVFGSSRKPVRMVVDERGLTVTLPDPKVTKIERLEAKLDKVYAELQCVQEEIDETRQAIYNRVPGGFDDLDLRLLELLGQMATVQQEILDLETEIIEGSP